jgi:hypothetical protein
MAKTQREKVLLALRSARVLGVDITNLELANAAGLRFGARIMELRDMGFEIEAKWIKTERHSKYGNGLWRYRLTHDRERD